MSWKDNQAMSSLTKLVTKYITRTLDDGAQKWSFDFERLSFNEQIAFILDTSKISLACGSRRMGKSMGTGLLLAYISTQRPDYDCLYITKTREIGKEILWKPLQAILRSVGIPFHANNSDLTISLTTVGSTIYFKSANDRESIEKLRGRHYKLVVLDEVQSFGEYVPELIREVLLPSLSDLQGYLRMLGTPNESCSGYFMDCVSEQRYRVHKWTWRENRFFVEKALRENKALTCADDILKDALETYKLDVMHPIIQREWFGNLVRSDDFSVYKYRDGVNDKECPPRNNKWSYVMGVDIGFEDASAIVVLGYSPTEKECYLVYEHKFQHANISTLAGHIQNAHKRFNPHYSVMDAGALGKSIQSELNTRFSFYLDAADKVRKSEFIAILNDELLLGRVFIAGTTDLAAEMRRLTWDEVKFKKGIYKEQDGLDNHLCDAFLYAFRKAYHYLSRPIDKGPTEHTEEWYELQDEILANKDHAYD